VQASSSTLKESKETLEIPPEAPLSGVSQHRAQIKEQIIREAQSMKRIKKRAVSLSKK